MLSSKYGFGQSMDCLGQSVDPYIEQAIHGLSKHKNCDRICKKGDNMRIINTKIRHCKTGSNFENLTNDKVGI